MDLKPDLDLIDRRLHAYNIALAQGAPTQGVTAHLLAQNAAHLLAEVRRLNGRVETLRDTADRATARADNAEDEARRLRKDMATARHEVAMLQTCGATLLRLIYESGIAYDSPDVDLALAAFADSQVRQSDSQTCES